MFEKKFPIDIFEEWKIMNFFYGCRKEFMNFEKNLVVEKFLTLHQILYFNDKKIINDHLMIKLKK